MDCPDCGGRMEEGFLPDVTHGQVLQGHWHPGKAEKAKFFGIPVGTKIARDRMLPVATFRCASCGLLRSYAPQKPKGR
jgi:hypothetical protein